MLSCFPASPTGDTTRSPVPLTLKLPRSEGHLGGLALSLILHAGLLALLVLGGDRIWHATRTPGPLLLSTRPAGGGGGNRVAYITLPSFPEPRVSTPPKAPPRPARPRAVTPPVEAEPVPSLPADTVSVALSADTVAQPSPDSDAAAVSGVGKLGEGQGPATGVGHGAGSGSGPGGGGGNARPPEPRDMAFPFDNPPKELRGVSLNVTFWVRVDGQVERYTVEPEIKDRDYAKKFDEVMRAFRFTPARAPSGRAVAGRTMITITLPGKHPS